MESHTTRRDGERVDDVMEPPELLLRARAGGFLNAGEQIITLSIFLLVVRIKVVGDVDIDPTTFFPLQIHTKDKITFS